MAILHKVIPCRTGKAALRGNAQPQGFGHIGFLVDDLETSCAKMEQDGVVFKKRPQDPHEVQTWPRSHDVELEFLALGVAHVVLAEKGFC